ncbi:SAM-dependent methyltransferase [Nitrobacteraceae bacterium AZCC 2161]
MVAALFAELGYDVAGLDISAQAVEWTNESFDAAGMTGVFRAGDVCNMPFYEDGHFDLVIDGNCLHCLVGDDRPRGLGEVRRVLRRGGAFVVSTMCGVPKSAEARGRFDPGSRCLLEDGKPSRTLIPIGEIIAELNVAGFRVVSQGVGENPWWDHATIVAEAI